MALPRFLIPAVVVLALIAGILVLVLRPAPEAPPTVSAGQDALVEAVKTAKLDNLPQEAGNPFMACETMVQKSTAPCEEFVASIPAELRATDPEFHEYDCAGDILNPYLDLLDLAAGAPCGQLRTEDGRQLCTALAAGCAGATGNLAVLCTAFKNRDPAVCAPLDAPPEGVTGEYALHFFGEFGCTMSLGYYRAARGDANGCIDGQEGAHRALCEAVTTGDCQGRMGWLFEDFARLELKLCDSIHDPWIAGKCREGVNAAEFAAEELGKLPS